MCTFKDHFLTILAGISNALPKYLWDLLPEQVDLTLNIIQQATINPRISAWDYFNCPFDYNVTPIGSIGCSFIIHKKTAHGSTGQM